MTNKERLKKLPILIRQALDLAFINACELAKSIATIKKLMETEKELKGEMPDETQEEIENHLQHCIVILEREYGLKTDEDVGNKLKELGYL